jgi:hypothetical protein
VDENDQPEYIGVKMGFLGTHSTVIPIELVKVNDRRKLVEVAADEETIEGAPTFDNDREITPEFENEVHSYHGLQQASSEERGMYADYSSSSGGSWEVGPGMRDGGTETDEFRGPADDEGVKQSASSDLDDEATASPPRRARVRVPPQPGPQSALGSPGSTALTFRRCAISRTTSSRSPRAESLGAASSWDIRFCGGTCISKHAHSASVRSVK